MLLGNFDPDIKYPDLKRVYLTLDSFSLPFHDTDAVHYNYSQIYVESINRSIPPPAINLTTRSSQS
jgi:hypothetical protein